MDPDAQELAVLTLRDGEYVETDRLAGAGALDADLPFPVTVSRFGPGS